MENYYDNNKVYHANVLVNLYRIDTNEILSWVSKMSVRSKRKFIHEKQ